MQPATDDTSPLPPFSRRPTWRLFIVAVPARCGTRLLTASSDSKTRRTQDLWLRDHPWKVAVFGSFQGCITATMLTNLTPDPRLTGAQSARLASGCQSRQYGCGKWPNKTSADLYPKVALVLTVASAPSIIVVAGARRQPLPSKGVRVCQPAPFEGSGSIRSIVHAST
jgi:hypothetical protein